MTKIKGIGVSGGIAIAKVHHFKQISSASIKRLTKDTVAEVKRFDDALKLADFELEVLVDQARISIGEEHAQIFSAQQMMLKDPEMLKNAYVKIKDFSLEAAFAFKQTMREMIDLFELSDNAYIIERIADLNDITRRVINILEGKDNAHYIFDHDVILVANDLLPSETINLDTKHIRGILIEKGSKTSHSAILARNLGIPAIIGIDISKFSEDELLIIDGKAGEVILSPTEDIISEYQKIQQSVTEKQKKFDSIKDIPAITKDGVRIHMAANIGLDADIEEAKLHNAEGIGLLRTENQYLESDDFPTEDELKDFYQKTSDAFKDERVVIRTLDIGGDKNLSYLNFRKEMNPFLGNRAIRYSLSYPSLLKTQLRAILKANQNQNIEIMFPMIATLNELLDAKTILEETVHTLLKDGVHVNKPKVGIMVEVPSTAFGIEKFLDHIDFISIGTNDLIQYLFAADRMNERVAYLYQPYNPILLNTLKSIVDKANSRGIIVSVCGEMAAHKGQSLILIGLGITHLSMHANIILENKYIISKSSYKNLKVLAHKALELNYDYEVETLIHEYIKGLNT
jgi:phosphotransferase system enzyme I (PtsI)